MKKNKKTKFFSAYFLLHGFLVLFFLWGSFLPVLGQELDGEARKNFLEITDNFCHASVGYSLDLRFSEAKKNYHETMGCLFDSAHEKAQKEMNQSFNDRFFDKIFTKNTFKTKEPDPVEGACGGRTIDEIYQAQTQKGFQTLCVVKGRLSTQELGYSACRVSEVAWNEFCAYQEYLAWKVSDQSGLEEYQKKEDSGQRLDLFSNFGKKANQYKNERRLAHRTLWASLEQFHAFEHNYRVHLWQKVIEQALLVTQAKLILLEEAFKSWPEKAFQS